MQLIDKEAVEKILKEEDKFVSKVHWNYSQWAIAIMNIKTFIDSLPTYGEWIPVSERLPTIQWDYLCMIESWISIVYYGNYSWLENTCEFYNNVTHWQPLPLPPSN